MLVVTGSSGEVGKALCELFSSTGQPYRTFEDFLGSEDAGGEEVRLVHLAARSDESDPDAILDSNVDYLRYVTGIAERRGINEIVYVSSASVYGTIDREDVAEDAPLVSPGLYGASKLIGEKILESCALRSLCLRLPAVLEYVKSSNFMSRMFDTLHCGENITLYNGERLFNNFIDVRSLGSFITSTSLHRNHDVINLACEKLLTLREIAELLHDIVDSDSRITTAFEQKPFFNLSIDKAVDEYKYRPGPVRDILAEWCRYRIDLAERTDE